jgi:hypothetical protein
MMRSRDNLSNFFHSGIVTCRIMPDVISNAPSPRSRIIFLHIHKTAGMSLRGLFVKNYRDGGHFNTGLMEIDAADWDACRDRVRRMHPETMAACQVFKGHMPFGLHELLPGPRRYITFLRDPVRRALSHYRMAVRKNQLPADHRIDPSLPDWNLRAAGALARSFDNGQTRMLAGADLRLPCGACTEEHLQLARHNLDTHFDFVGLTEQFDLSLMLLRRVCGWKWRFYVPDNVAPVDSIFIPSEIVEQVRALNRFDVELYRHAQERFRLLLENYGWRLRGEHQLFVQGNRGHQLLHQWRHARKTRRLGRQRPAMRPLPAGSAVLHHVAAVCDRRTY